MVGLPGANAVRSEVRKGLPSPDGSAAAFVCMAHIWIKPAEAFLAILEKHGADLMGDIPNDTDIQPILQVDEIVS